MTTNRTPTEDEARALAVATLCATYRRLVRLGSLPGSTEQRLKMAQAHEWLAALADATEAGHRDGLDLDLIIRVAGRITTEAAS